MVLAKIKMGGEKEGTQNKNSQNQSEMYKKAFNMIKVAFQ